MSRQRHGSLFLSETEAGLTVFLHFKFSQALVILQFGCFLLNMAQQGGCSSDSNQKPENQNMKNIIGSPKNDSPFYSQELYVQKYTISIANIIDCKIRFAKAEN